ncbi:MAG: ribonuclease P protein component [Chloroflexi bacterium]|nr:ribonuclease P protein component [Chloroflexota bacterium]
MVSRDQRLRKRADFDHVRSHGKRVSDRLFVLIVAPSEPDQTRWGLAVSRRVGNAVVRNRVKRKIRESIRDIRCINGQDVIVSARPAAADAGSESVRSSLRQLAGRAGLTSPPAAVGSEFIGVKS